MKNISTKILRTLAVGVSTLALVLTFGTTALAAGFNDAPSGDCPTLSIGNVTTGEGISSPCWNSANINAKSGDVLNVKVYFHNTTQTTASNVTIRITDPGTSSVTGSKYFAGTVYVGGTSVASGQGNVTATGTIKYRLVKVTVQRQSTNGAITELPNPSAILSGTGISIGSVEPGWNGQGVVKAVFAIDGTGTSSSLNVGTGSISGYDSTNGNVTLGGYASGATSVFFRYRVNNGSWTNTSTQNLSSGNFSTSLSGLSSGNYEYQACATDSSGTTKCGLVNSNTDNQSYVGTFSISRGGSGSCPSGTFGYNGTCYSNCPSGTTFNYSNLTCVSNTVSCGTGYYLSGNTCVQISCGAGYYLSGNTCVQDSSSNSLPSASTLGTISVGARVAAVDGYFNAYGCTAYTSFNYGTNPNALTMRTNEVARTGTGSMAQSLSDLSTNTTYYYQAVVRNCVGTTTGTVRPFTTGTDTVRDNVIIRTVTNTTTNSGTGTGSFIKLMITNNREMVRSAKETTYDVAWENVSGRDLQNLVLEVNFPTQVTVVDTDHGSIKRDAHSVVYKIGDLAKKEKGDMSIVIDAAGNLRDGDPVVAQAIMAFENPKTAATENAIAYDADEFSTAAATGSAFGASVFGLGFLPTSLAGWLLILLILLVIALLVHSYLSRNRAHAVAVTPVPAPMYDAGAPGNDYVVYRPTPKQ